MRGPRPTDSSRRRIARGVSSLRIWRHLAKSSWWIGYADESIAAFERAYALHLERGNRSMAAMMALTLRREYGAKMAGSVAKAWLHRAEHLLEGEPEAVAHGYLEIAP